MPDFSIYRNSVRNLNRNMRFFLATAFFVCLAQAVDIVLLNLYLKNVGFSNTQLGEIESMRFLASMILSVPCGLLSDRLGRRKTMLLSITLCSLAHGLRAVLLSQTALMAATFLQGGSYTLLFITIPPFIAEQVAEEHRGTIFSLFFASFTGVGIIGYMLGGVLPDLLHGMGSVLVHSQRLTLLLGAGIFSIALLPTVFIREQERGVGVASAADEIGARLNENTVNEFPQIDGVDPASVTDKQSAIGFLETMRRLPAAERRAIISFTIPEIFSGIGSALIVPLMTVFFSSQYQMSSSTIGVVEAAGELSIIVATFLGPFVMQRFGIVKAIAMFQLASAPFLLLMGNAPLLPLALVGYLVRGALMNSLSPLKSTLQMQRVSAAYRGFAASCAEVGFSLSRTIFASIGGRFSESYGFPALYSFASIFYIASGVLYFLLNREKAA